MTKKGTTGTHHVIKEGHIPTKRNKTGRYSPLKGKKLEEIYGEEKANSIKAQLSEQKIGEKNPIYKPGVLETMTQTIVNGYMNGRKPSSSKNQLRTDIVEKVKSSWEADFIRILNYENIDYIYEPCFSLKYFDKDGKEKITNYFPDFYIKSENIYIEIKGHRSDIKFKMFLDQYKKNAYIIYKNEFNILIALYKDVINLENKATRILISQIKSLSSETTRWNYFLNLLKSNKI